MWHVTVAWVFGAAWMFIVSGAALTQFALKLGVTRFGFGLMVALPFAGALLQIPSSYFVARYGHRKALLLVSGIVHRALWFAIAAVPWLLPKAWWWPGLLTLMALASMCAHVMSPAVMSWFADLIPARIGGRYFSRRNQIGRAVGLVATLVVSYVLDRAQAAGDQAVLRMASLALAVAAACGVIDFLTLTPVPDVIHRPNPTMSLRRLFREPLADRNFRRFMGFTATLNLGTIFVWQFIWLYLLKVAGMSNSRANLLLIVVPLLVSLASFQLWGRLVDRIGCKASMILAGLLIVHGAAAWIFVTPRHWVPGYLAVLISTAAWPGVELSSFNIILRMSASHGGRRQGSAYTAMNSIVVAIAGVLSGLLGGTVAKLLGDWRGSILGWPLTYHGVLFLISGVLRLASLGWLIRFEEPRGRTTKAAVQYLMSSIRLHLRRVLQFPVPRLRGEGSPQTVPPKEATHDE